MKKMKTWMKADWKTAAMLTLLLGAAARGQDTTIGAAGTASLLARSGVVTMKVDDYDSVRAQVLAQARSEGGELLDAKTEVNPKGKKHGWLRLRLPANRLPRLIPQVQTDGKLYAETVATVDNASEYAQLARRIESLQQHQKRLSGVLESPRKMRGSDVLYLQERLFRANVDEGMLRQQRVDFERSAVQSALTVSLFEPGAEPTPPAARVNLSGWFNASFRRAWDTLTRQAARGATVAAYALVYAPFWLPALIVALFLLRALWTRRQAIARGLMTLTAGAARALRAVWDARHQPIGLPPRTEA